MSTSISLKLLIASIFLSFFLIGYSSAEEPTYKKIQLAYGISIEIPSHWNVLSMETKLNIKAAAEETLKNSGIESTTDNKARLLAVNATPYPTGAMIRVSVTSPLEFYTQAELSNLTPADITDIAREFSDIFKNLAASGDPQIIDLQKIRIDKFNNHQVLVIPYIRAGANEASQWQVTQYKIPTADKLIEITLSYRLSESILWRPILEHVKRSVRY